MTSLIVVIRRLLRTPLFALFAMGSLSLAISSTATSFSVVRALAPRGLLIPRSSEIAVITRTLPGDPNPDWQRPLSLDELALFRDEEVVGRRIGASGRGVQTWSRSDGQEAVVAVEFVNEEYFSVLSPSLATGRSIAPEDVSSHAAVAVVSDRLFHALGGRGGLESLQIELTGRRFAVVGVVPAAFGGLSTGRPLATEVWLPFTTGQDDDMLDRRSDQRQFAACFVSPPDLSVASMSARLTQSAGRLARPRSQDRGPQTVSVLPAAQVSEPGLTSLQQSALVLLVSLVLVVACVNLASMMLARGLARRFNLFLKASLGASRTRLVVEEVLEGGVIALGGGICGALLTGLASKWTGTLPFRAGVVTQIRPEMSGATIVVLVLLPMIALVLIGVIPALTLTRDLRSGLASGNQSQTTPALKSGAVLIRVQVALSTTLLIVAVLMAVPLWRLSLHSPGVQLESLVVGDINVNGVAGHDLSAGIDELLSSLSRVPGVKHASVAQGLPFGIHAPLAYLGGFDDRRTPIQVVSVSGSSDLMATLQIPLTAGRTLVAADEVLVPEPVVVSVSTAQALWRGENAVGRTIRLASRPNETLPVIATIVGVAADTDVVQFGSRDGGVIYRPLKLKGPGHLALVVSVDSGLAPSSALLRQTAAASGAGFGIGSLDEGTPVLAGSYVVLKYVSWIAGFCALLTLCLAMLGLCAVLMQLVEAQRRDFGVRLALGATRRSVAQTIIAAGMWPVGQGLIVSVALSGLTGILIGVRAGASLADNGMLMTLLIVPVLLAAATLAACYIPALRAMRVDPKQLLQSP